MLEWKSWRINKKITDKCHEGKFLKLDGGLTFNIIEEHLSAEINGFSGWSIIADESPKFLKNALKLKKIISMNILIPMSGTGSRFVNKGYQDIKPLINVFNKPIIKYIIKKILPTSI